MAAAIATFDVTVFIGDGTYDGNDDGWLRFPVTVPVEARYLMTAADLRTVKAEACRLVRVLRPRLLNDNDVRDIVNSNRDSAQSGRESCRVTVNVGKWLRLDTVKDNEDAEAETFRAGMCVRGYVESVEQDPFAETKVVGHRKVGRF